MFFFGGTGGWAVVLFFDIVHAKSPRARSKNTMQSPAEIPRARVWLSETKYYSQFAAYSGVISELLVPSVLMSNATGQGIKLLNKRLS